MFSALWNAASSMWSTERGGSDVSKMPPRSQSVSTPVLLPPARELCLPWQESVGDAGFSEELSLQWTGSASNKLFVQLLDDLDDLSSNSPSAHRRRRAREIFSEWLFSADLRSPAEGPGGLRRDQPFRRSAADYGPVLRTDESQKYDEKARRRCSGDFSCVNVMQQQESSPQHRLLARRSLDDRRHSEPLNVILSEVSGNWAQCHKFVIITVHCFNILDCRFTCHHNCHPLVTLDCSGLDLRPVCDTVIRNETSFAISNCTVSGVLNVLFLYVKCSGSFSRYIPVIFAISHQLQLVRVQRTRSEFSLSLHPIHGITSI